MTDNKNCCENNCLCDLLKKAKEEDSYVFYQCNFCCCCKDNNDNSGQNPDPDPQPGDSCKCGEDCDCTDCDCKDCPHEGGQNPDPVPQPGDGDGPGDGEYVPPSLEEKESNAWFVTPHVATIYDDQTKVDQTKELIFSWYEPGSNDQTRRNGPQGATGDDTWIIHENNTNRIAEYYFRRYQYVSSYIMQTNTVNAPKSWNLYLSKNGGINWTLADSKSNVAQNTNSTFTLEDPGYYDAYKIEILENQGGSTYVVPRFRLMGTPTEIIPSNVTATGNIVTFDDFYFYGFYAPNFQNLTETVYSTSANLGASNYLQFNQPKLNKNLSKCRYVGLMVEGDALDGWTLFGSDGSARYITLQTVTNCPEMQPNTLYYFPLEIPMEKAYLYYQFRVDKVRNGSSVKINYLQLYR